MVICPQCSKDNADKDPRCASCGASLVGITDEQNKEAILQLRRRNRLRNHMVTGAILCFGLPTLVGLPSSLLPLSILTNAIGGILCGVPLGYLVSTYARSVLGGAAIGGGIGIVYAAVILLMVTHQLSAGAILLGIGYGLIPGAIMGWHVTLE